MTKALKGYRTTAVEPTGKFHGAALTHMREVAFGAAAHFETRRTVERAERMRDDDALLAKAEEKRKRKMAKRAGR